MRFYLNNGIDLDLREDGYGIVHWLARDYIAMAMPFPLCVQSTIDGRVRMRFLETPRIDAPTCLWCAMLKS